MEKAFSRLISSGIVIWVDERGKALRRCHLSLLPSQLRLLPKLCSVCLRGEGGGGRGERGGGEEGRGERGGGEEGRGVVVGFLFFVFNYFLFCFF